LELVVLAISSRILTVLTVDLAGAVIMIIVLAIVVQLVELFLLIQLAVSLHHKVVLL
jgi:hypothetical protein